LQELFIIQQIYSDKGSHLDAWFYRTQDGTECDLLLTSGNKPVACIEAKFTSAPSKSKSLTVAINDLDTSQNFIIIPKCDESFKLSEKITVCNIYQFIKTYLPEIR
jgi:predicted AAA+ superfamily ATPase